MGKNSYSLSVLNLMKASPFAKSPWANELMNYDVNRVNH